jgi:hypothetical protein
MLISPSYQEFLMYLAEKASPEEILAFRVSEASEQRADELTELNKAGRLTADEARELQQMLEFDEMMTLLKLRALKVQRALN